MTSRIALLSHFFVVGLAAADYSLSPKLLERGRTYTLLVEETGCSSGSTALTGARLETHTTGLELSDQSATGCQVSARVRVAADAQYGPANLNLVKGDGAGRQFLKTLTVEVAAVTPEPTPPGLEKQVDIMWKVLPWRQTADSYGRKIAGQYYAIEISMGNNTGYSLLLETIGFVNPSFGNPPVPNDAYGITRSTIEREQQTNFRAFLFNGIQMAATIGAGAAPFVKNMGSTNPLHVGSKAQYGFWLGLANPLVTGLSYIYPDKTVRHLVALDTRAFRGGMIVKNNETRPIYTFLSRELIECRRSCATNANGRIAYNGRGFDPVEIRKKLGSMVIVGDKIDYLNRIRVVSGSPAGPPPVPPVVHDVPLAARTVTQGASIDLRLTGNGLTDLVPSAPTGSGLTVERTLNDPNGRTATVRVTAAATAPVGTRTIALSTQGGSTQIDIIVVARQ